MIFTVTAWELLAINIINPGTRWNTFKKQRMSIQDTPLKINMEPKNEGLVQMIFLFKQVMFRCKMFIFLGCRTSWGFLIKATSPPNSPKKTPKSIWSLDLWVHLYYLYIYLYHPPPKKKKIVCTYNASKKESPNEKNQINILFWVFTFTYLINTFPKNPDPSKWLFWGPIHPCVIEALSPVHWVLGDSLGYYYSQLPFKNNINGVSWFP